MYVRCTRCRHNIYLRDEPLRFRRVKEGEWYFGVPQVAAVMGVSQAVARRWMDRTGEVIRTSTKQSHRRINARTFKRLLMEYARSGRTPTTRSPETADGG